MLLLGNMTPALAATLSSLSLSPDTPSLNVGQTLQMQATAYYSDGASQVLATAVKAISAGNSHTCAVLNDGSVRCWGNNSSGKLGDGSTTDSSIPVAVSGISTAVEVSAGSNHSCAVLSDGSVRCWGDNFSGQLGNGSTARSSTPVAVSGLSTVVAVSAGSSYSCAVLSDGAVRCW
ncbi:MAG: hypothetical protein Q7S51_03530, partial [Gallionellaceae bacterium]|nr:hypothetical protein [Gallionellaceae bacterium]